MKTFNISIVPIGMIILSFSRHIIMSRMWWGTYHVQGSYFIEDIFNYLFSKHIFYRCNGVFWFWSG